MGVAKVNASSAWFPVGSPLTSDRGYYISSAIDTSGTPYIAYAEAQYVIVKKFDSGSGDWVAVGSPLTSGYPGDVSIAISPSGTPYVSYEDDSLGLNGFVKKFDSGSGDWVLVGSPLTTNGTTRTSIAVNASGTPYVAYLTVVAGENVLLVKKFDNDTNNWVVLGSSPVVTGPSVMSNNSLSIDSLGTLYVAYSDANSVLVKKFDSDTNNWVLVGTPVSTRETSAISFFISSSDIPYVAYADYSNDIRGMIKKFDSGSGNWVPVGSPISVIGSSSGEGTTNSIFLSINASGTPYVAYIDGNNNNRGTVKKFDSGSGNWVPVGLPFSVAEADYLSLFTDTSGTLYAVFSDCTTNNCSDWSTNPVIVKEYRTVETDTENEETTQFALAVSSPLHLREGVDTNVITTAQTIVDSASSGVLVSPTVDSSNSQIATDGTVTYGGSYVTDNVTFTVSKNAASSTQVVSVTVPAHTLTNAENVALAKTIVSEMGPWNPVEGTDYNAITSMQAIVNGFTTGVAVTISANNNAQIGESGMITYGNTEVTGDVTFTLSKNSATDNQTISVVVPVYAVTAKVTGPNEITVHYPEEVNAEISDYTNLTGDLSGQSIVGISGSPGNNIILNLNGPALPTNATGTVDIGPETTIYDGHSVIPVPGQVVSDGQVPGVVSAKFTGSHTVTIVYSEAVDPGAPNDYSDFGGDLGGLTSDNITDIAGSSTATTVLTFDNPVDFPLNANNGYLTINGRGAESVKDLAGNDLVETILNIGDGQTVIINNSPGTSGGGFITPKSIPGCDNRTTGFSITTGQPCTQNTKITYDFGPITLKFGSQNDYVKELQRFLNKFLNLNLAVNGKFGLNTLAAVKQWQKDHGLVTDGRVGTKTKKEMYTEAGL